ncbi:RUN and FYVE domain-containing protein 2-like isoform X4 [Ostrea edulis]|uniref:RUN and FYVE domain-containing protein 2-like isoform X4 n=1 Tax=Ostrea edulis TaxID=37623 RepID=UPI0020942102|nr:RUN and FYVE domain-containing protein 2-like isoform X4 [Ostrea edulis]
MADDSQSHEKSLESENKNATANYWPKPVVESQNKIDINSSARSLRYQRRDPQTIERCNLLNVSKLIIKEVIDSSLSHGRMLDDNHVPLQQFFIVLEHVLRHGLKPKKSLLRDRRDFWCVLETVEKLVPEASEITTSVREMPNLKTPLGKARAWLRLSLMQKSLADYLKILCERRDQVLNEFYEPGAMMLEDEGMVFTGLLVGLNVIDCNMCIKEEDLDQPMGVIDFSLYLNNRINDDMSPDNESPETKNKMATILDQKNYLEELNRHLNATVTNLQQKLESVQTTNTLLKEDLAIAKNTALELQDENDTLKNDQGSLVDGTKKQLEATLKQEQAAKQDIETERETYKTSREGLDNMYTDLKKKLEEETHVRLDVEKELELQISMKQEIEMALRILEKDIHEKQDTMISLRQQLEDIKGINLEMYKKLQACESTLKHKSELVSKLEEKTNQLVSTLKDMEKRTALETDLKIEREWRGTLQRSLEEEKEKLAVIQTDLHKYKHLEKEYTTLEHRHREIQQTCEEQEKTLAELGSHLSESKLRVEDMREAQQVKKEAQWMSDKEATNCKGCSKEFSISRRRHHCRNCGDIFCNECSDNKMPLPSSAKPVRVCDNCHTVLLQRYSSTGN